MSDSDFVSENSSDVMVKEKSMEQKRESESHVFGCVYHILLYSSTFQCSLV